ncbi:adenylate cyclase, terminal-differentiation specific isoform X2 [Zeugodacus cucurbitae]|uniref:adenylate cyclase, terminal-differentiation specific isoform X2 n=1 Tax=Zeugodacus cucurbitae TaxID=28588 RepID=UPI0023D968C9|nr:adenylate cyclase, terminal-differentiation specific isoform X2 [Zeugodacus cucurbitae]
MVLTNFECWAHGGAVMGNDELPVNSRPLDMFNPRSVQQRLSSSTDTSPVSHISSNGYYGFSYVNAAHELADNNTNVNNNNNNNNINNNNNTCVPNANDVNGMLLLPTLMHNHNHNNNSMDVSVASVGATAAFGSPLNATQRCKKRYFVSDDDYANCALLNGCDSAVGIRDVAVAGLDVCAAKRCRFDDDYAAAQYCNDFFSLPSTQIGTQSCLMDTEDTPPQQQQQQQQPQVDVITGAANLTNTTSNTHYNTTQQQQHEQQLQQQQQQQQVINASNYQQQNAAQAPPIVVYQQQHNYHGHLHRANRDVSRCLLSHMI